MSDPSEDRKPASVYGVGEEPDPRFTLANERTALAWMRTALALVAGGIALISVSSLADLPRWAALVGGAACAGGALLSLRAVSGWARTERALRVKEPLPAPRALFVLGVAIAVLSLVTLGLGVLQEVRR